jgi:putative membrane protein
MNPQQKPFLIRWCVTMVAVVVAAGVVPGIHSDGWLPLMITALFLGIANALVRPVVLLLSLPFILVTLGLFILVVNALLLWGVSGVVPGFRIDGFWSAFFGALVVSVVSWAVSAFFRGSDGRVHPISAHLSPKPANARVVE